MWSIVCIFLCFSMFVTSNFFIWWLVTAAPTSVLNRNVRLIQKVERPGHILMKWIRFYQIWQRQRPNDQYDSVCLWEAKNQKSWGWNSKVNLMEQCKITRYGDMKMERGSKYSISEDLLLRGQKKNHSEHARNDVSVTCIMLYRKRVKGNQFCRLACYIYR